MSARRIVFLDFDGVINRVSKQGYYLSSPVEPQIERRLALRVGGMVERLNASVVVSSDWRHNYTLGELRRFLQVYGGIPTRRVLGVTENGWVRGEEIQNWLKGMGEPVHLAILDDNHEGRFSMDGVREWFVKTTPEKGVSEENIAAASKLLTTGPLYSVQSVAQLTNA